MWTFVTSMLSSLAPRSDMTANGEVERPPRSADQAPRAHTVFPRPRRVTTHRSRTPPTIVRRLAQTSSLQPSEPSLNVNGPQSSILEVEHDSVVSLHDREMIRVEL